MAERGEVRAVGWMPQGSELSSDAALGATSLVVANPVDFDEDGGTVDLNGVQYDYDTCDMDTGTITLSSATTVAAVSGDLVKVWSGGMVAIDYVAFVSLGDGDEVEVPIPYGDRDLWPEGEYTAPVLVELSDDLEELTAVPGRTPLRDGKFIDPTTLPPPTIPASDGLVPSTAPTGIVVTGGIGAMFVRWTPISNKDAVTYDLHVSPTSGFTPDSTTLVVSTAGSSHTLRQLPTPVGVPPNQALSYEATYYFRVIPRDVDGAGPTSAEASGSMVRVTGPDVAANTITGDRIVGNTITGDLFASQVVLGSTISTGGLDDNGDLVGARVDLGPDGITTYAPDGVTPVVNFPLDPADDAFIHNAHVTMLSADVLNNLTVYGQNNELAASSTLQLGAGTTAPSTPPTLATTYDTVQLNTTTQVPSNGGTNQDYNLGTFALDPSQITSICWDTVYFCWQVFQQKSTGFRLWRFNADGTFKLNLGGAIWVDDFRGMTHVSGCRNGWLQLWTDGKWYAWETVTSGGTGNRWGIIPNSWLLNGPSDPFMAFDEAAQLSMLVQNDTYANDTIQVRRFHTVPYVAGAIQNAVSDSVVTSPLAVQRGGAIVGAYYGNADFGGPRYVNASGNYNRLRVWGPGVTYNGAANFAEWDAPTRPLGLGFDGTNFWTVDSTGKMTKYTGWTWPAEPSTTWVGMSAYDSNATGGTHETPVGTLGNRNAARRAKLTITVPATQASGGTDDPDKWRVYWARTTGATPTASAMRLVSALGSPTLPTSVTVSGDPSGAVPPGGIFGQAGAVNTFPAGNPAQLLDGAGNVMVDAQGHGSVGMVGEIRMYGGASAPVGWLLCDGSSVLRSTYPALFAVVGVAFGQGSNSPAGTTFNLPDMRSRLPLGVGGIAALGQTEAGTPGVIAGTPPTEDANRVSRWGHSHSHTTGGTGSAHTHNIPAQVAGTTVSGGTSSGNAPTNASYVGHAHGGDTGTTGSGHSHNVSTDSAIGVGTVHAATALNYIIRT